MIISIDWIKDFVNIPDMSPDELAVKFTLATCEVEEVLMTGELLNNVTVAEITEVNPHPDSEHLHLVKFETGKGIREVVCGAPNVAPGKKVPFAPIGTTFPGGFTLTPKKIRGVMSEGMLCSETELSIGSDDSGLAELPEDAVIGETMLDHLGRRRDILLDIDNKSLTHRPDLWGHYGMAREFAAVFGQDLKKPYGEAWEKELTSKFTEENSPVTIEVDADSACLGFSGIAVDGVTVQDSPRWMKDRLEACGLRAINNIVDISNYVMLELGHPLHMFDRDTIKGGKIIVRRAGDRDKTFTTLDEVERELNPADTLVCDTEGPSSIAGIMGGLDSGVKETTSRIFIEVANWVDSEVRMTSSRLGLRTDASQRYEKCLDTRQVKQTLLRTLDLVLQLCPEAKVVGGIVSDGNKEEKAPLVLEMTPEHICRVLGKELETGKIVLILESLDFSVEMKGELLSITVPSYRATKDIECDADIIEEVGRIIGYDNIVPVSPLNTISAVRLSNAKKMARNIQDFLVLRARAHEVLTYPMVGAKLLEKSSWHQMNEELILANAMSPESDRMRPSLVPSLLQAAALNQKTNSSFRLFEIGRSYLPDEKKFSTERNQVGLVWFSKKESPFMDLLNNLEDMFAFLNLKVKMSRPDYRAVNPYVDPEWKGLHPNETLNFQVMGKVSGFITSVHPVVCRDFKIKGNLVIAVLDLADFEEKQIKDKTGYKPLSRFPSSIFDCTVVADEKEPVASIVSVLNKLKLKELDSVRVVDIYKMDNGTKAVTIRTTFTDREKTLSGEFISSAEQSVMETLEKGGFPLKQ
ncbi:phenylalanine--tRNA ligase subunit beta [Spirochaeta isovalerica]|uniref:Phenylalanine--tRNA ligase beta subunit n=1 Tax=Spirochaeta isovalerica TaxID=150 RepID=A0A841RGE3_9SPIO|nr:phenylalanine--tRNA ligase subunit beta [Spirochaeta isovalerica]MBB6482080.1 phenylalanyl-tRNA synthetase beta chain [Spirochaeta isovalerica]